MSDLGRKRSERSSLLQRLQELRGEIKDQELIDLDEKWDKLRNIPGDKIKLYNIDDHIDTSIFSNQEENAYKKYVGKCQAMKELLTEFNAYYQTDIHKNIVKKVITQVNNQENWYSHVIKRGLLNALTSKTKRLYL